MFRRRPAAALGTFASECRRRQCSHLKLALAIIPAETNQYQLIELRAKRSAARPAIQPQSAAGARMQAARACRPAIIVSRRLELGRSRDGRRTNCAPPPPSQVRQDQSGKPVGRDGHLWPAPPAAATGARLRRPPRRQIESSA